MARGTASADDILYGDALRNKKPPSSQTAFVGEPVIDSHVSAQGVVLNFAATGQAVFLDRVEMLFLRNIAPLKEISAKTASWQLETQNIRQAADILEKLAACHLILRDRSAPVPTEDSLYRLSKNAFTIAAQIAAQFDQS